jgi:hypothetical protein
VVVVGRIERTAIELDHLDFTVRGAVGEPGRLCLAQELDPGRAQRLHVRGATRPWMLLVIGPEPLEHLLRGGIESLL